MQKETARKAAEVMLAYANGEQIELVSRTGKTGDWSPAYMPLFNWSDFDYRVARDPRKITNLKQLLCEMEKHPAHGFLKSKESGYVVSITGADDHGLMLSAFIGSSQFWDWDSVAERYEFVNGSPFRISE